MQIMDDGTAAEIEQVLAGPTVARPTPLPVAHVGQSMLHRHPLPQLRAPGRALLARPQLSEQPFIQVVTLRP